LTFRPQEIQPAWADRPERTADEVRRGGWLRGSNINRQRRGRK